ncbi:MAG TPA: hypothetical protein VI172_14335 [Candidatus Dormibacteraeota bacterium]
MYRIAIVRKGQPADRRTASTGRELRDIAWETLHAEGHPVTDYGTFTDMVADARRMADTDGFAALEFGAAAITIRPASAAA